MIDSQEHLRRLLEQVSSLNAADVDEIVASAHYTKNGTINGIYAGPLLAKASHSEIATFLKSAGLQHPKYTPDCPPVPSCAIRNDREI